MLKVVDVGDVGLVKGKKGLHSIVVGPITQTHIHSKIPMDSQEKDLF